MVGDDPSSSPLPFLEAIRARGNAPPSAHRPQRISRETPTAKKSLSKIKAEANQSWSNVISPSKKSSGVFRNIPLPAATNNSPAAPTPKAPSPSAKALMEGLRAGQGVLRSSAAACNTVPKFKQSTCPQRSSVKCAPSVSPKKISPGISPKLTPILPTSHLSPTRSDCAPAESLSPTTSTRPETPAPPDCGLRLHKSGKYQVIVDKAKLIIAFQRLSCKYG